MSIQVALHHHTRYEYERSIRVDPQLVRLRPAYHARTPIIAYGIEVSPDDHFRNWQQDPFGNPMARYVFPEKIDHLDITVDLIADMTVINPFDFFIAEYADQFPFDYQPENLRQLSPYLSVEEDDPSVDDFVAKMPLRTDRLVDFLVEVNQIAHRRVDYTVRLEPGVQTPAETLRIGRGSCRDSAWLLTQVFRKLGMAARFVSGYLIQLTA
ncbi:MAG: transglutaminase family protein, partial [Planctomycetota bacterium]